MNRKVSYEFNMLMLNPHLLVGLGDQNEATFSPCACRKKRLIKVYKLYWSWGNQRSWGNQLCLSPWQSDGQQSQSSLVQIPGFDCHFWNRNKISITSGHG